MEKRRADGWIFMFIYTSDPYCWWAVEIPWYPNKSFQPSAGRIY
jgi:hypothetical protein